MKIEKFDKSSFAGTEAEQSTNADNEHVSQPNANTIVVGIPKRIFKFKFWLGHTKKMTYEHSLIEISHAHWDFTEDIIPLPFTGFKDVKGNEIYEGDILSLWYSRDTTGKDIVRFNHVVAWEETNGFSGWNIPFLETAEIIGNAFENPELLHSVA